MAGQDIQINALPTSAGMAQTDFIHIKKGTIDYKINYQNFMLPHVGNLSNPHQVTKAQVGLGTVTDALQLVADLNLGDLPSTAIARTNLGVYSVQEVDSAIQVHVSDSTNPHNVTKAQVGLGAVADALQLVATSNLFDVPNKGQARNNLDVPSTTEVLSLHESHANIISGNPHNVTKTEVGLGFVQNYGITNSYSDNSTDIYVSGKALVDGLAAVGNNGSIGLTNHINDLDNPHQVTKAQVGLGSVRNYTISNSYTSDSGAVYASSKAVRDGLVNERSAWQASLGVHVNDNTNPHNVTKSQVGLGAVNNWGASSSITSDSAATYATSRSVKLAVEAAEAYTNSALDEYLPRGMIIMWSGTVSTIPAGWALCNGFNGTPNLQNRFIYGAGDERSPLDTGGSKTSQHSHAVTVGGTALEWNQIPPHQHATGWGENYTDRGYGRYGIAAEKGRRNAGSAASDFDNYDYLSSSRIYNGSNSYRDSADEHTHEASSANATVNIIPPFIALCYIMKL